MSFLRSIILGSALCAVSAAVAVAAPVTYHLSSVNPTNSVSGYGVTYVGVNTPLTLDFTLAAPLAVNLGPIDIVPQVLSYKASGGQAESTITDLDYIGGFKQFELATDAQGNITNFHFHVVGKNLVLPNPPTYLDFDFQGFNGALTSENLLFYRADRQFGYGVAACANANCGTKSGFTVLAGAASAVPEPATWAMFLVGLGGIGFLMRARRKGVVATV